MTPVASGRIAHEIRPPVRLVPSVQERAHWTAGPLATLPPIALDDMGSVTFQHRVDTKYVFREEVLPELLAAIGASYCVLDIAGTRLQPYLTRYFDTPAFDFYRAHHSGRANRYKVRSRWYAASGQAFIEVKRRTPDGRTSKARQETSGLVECLGRGEAAFIGRHVASLTGPLGAVLDNAFSRITLVGRDGAERVTIDLGLRFEAGRRVALLPGLAIAEVKRAGPARESPLAECMRARRIRPSPFSKYCIGLALLEPSRKHNAFKPLLRRIEFTTGEPPCLSR